MMMITPISFATGITPAARSAGAAAAYAGRFTASIDGRVVVESNRQPFLETARVLIAEGYNPSATIIMRRAGSTVNALRAKLGAAARLTVREDTTSFEAWKPHPAQDAKNSPAGASIRGLNGLGGPQPAQTHRDDERRPTAGPVGLPDLAIPEIMGTGATGPAR
jgi:hypothetical protein